MEVSGGVNQCGYLQHIGPADQAMIVPAALRASFQGQNSSTWVLLTHGSRAWSVKIVDGVFCCGWQEFRQAHELMPNYKIVLGCERRWIFETRILDENSLHSTYDWTDGDLYQ